MEIYGKIIVLDFSIFAHRAIFSSRFNKQVPIEYTTCSMILGCLSKIGVEPVDEIFVATDTGKSWRKQFDTQYKANRKALRESYEDINWAECYGKMDQLKDQLNKVTNWHFLSLLSIEADDWMAVLTEYFPNNEVVIVSYDKDLEQLLIRPNVKIFSPLTKMYKIIDNPYKLLAEKIEVEKSDNLINPVLNAEDFEKRNMLVNLLTLPDFITAPMKMILKDLESKLNKPDQFPFTSLRNRYKELYTNKKNLVTFESCVKKLEKKALKKKKEQKEKRDAKKKIRLDTR